MKKYKSKIGIGIVLFIAIILGFTSTLMIINHAWPGLIINLIVIGFISYMFTSTYYIINGNDLIIKWGFMINMTVHIDQIKKVTKTSNPLSSPATSLDRLAIYYGKSGFVMVSPKDKMDFSNQLIGINPGIQLILNKDKKHQAPTVHISNGGACRLSKGSNSIVISSSWDNDSLRTPATTHMRNVVRNPKRQHTT